MRLKEFEELDNWALIYEAKDVWIESWHKVTSKDLLAVEIEWEMYPKILRVWDLQYIFVDFEDAKKHLIESKIKEIEWIKNKIEEIKNYKITN